MSFGSLAKQIHFQLAVVKISHCLQPRGYAKCKLLWHCLSLLLHMELQLKGDLMTGTMVKEWTQLQEIFLLLLWGHSGIQSWSSNLKKKSDAYINNLKTSFKMRVLRRNKLGRSKTYTFQLLFSTTLKICSRWVKVTFKCLYHKGFTLRIDNRSCESNEKSFLIIFMFILT